MKVAPKRLVNKLSLAWMLLFISAEAAAIPLSVTHEMQEQRSAVVGPFSVEWRGGARGEEQLIIKHTSRPNEQIWQTIPGQSFLTFAVGSEKFTEVRGSVTLKDKTILRCQALEVSKWQQLNGKLTIGGRVNGEQCAGQWEASFFAVDGTRLGISIYGKREKADDFNRLSFSFASPVEERVYGFGMQFSRLDMKGAVVPVLTQEQGVGRGRQPLSWAVNATQGRGVAGNWASSYAAVPAFLSSAGYGVLVDQYEFSEFDLSKAHKSSIQVFAPTLSMQLVTGDSLADLIESYTRWSGRMEPLPEWVGHGAIIGVQGGIERVRRLYEKLKDAGVAVSALWIQDWVGRRKTSFGSQLWWNWELDQSSYAGLADFATELRHHGVRLLTYVNPFLADPSSKTGVRRDLFREAKTFGYLVKNQFGEPYMIQNTSFAAGLVDLSHNEARAWYKQVIQDQVLVTGASGWMADFGEAMPFDAQLSKGTAQSYHNQYPEDWAQLNREVLEEAGVWQDSLVFSRSGFARSPGKTRLFWLGDQLVSWDGYDGLRSALMGLLTSGFTGFSLNHSDTGGYTTIDNPVFKFHRSSELLRRWTELNAFTAVLRTHEGNIPEVNAQIYDDGASMAHFAKFSRVYAVLAEYRRVLMDEASQSGMPLVRPVGLMYPDDSVGRKLASEFLLGPSLLICPVLQPGKTQVWCYLPEGSWRHLGSGQIFKKGWHGIHAPIGKPAVFYHQLPGESASPLWVEKLSKLIQGDSAG